MNYEVMNFYVEIIKNCQIIADVAKTVHFGKL
jgi:hypothetical protein